MRSEIKDAYKPISVKQFVKISLLVLLITVPASWLFSDGIPIMLHWYHKG